MNVQPKSRTSVYLTLGAGFVLGGLCVAFLPHAIGKAHAESPETFQARQMSNTNHESVQEMRDLDAFYSNLAAFVQPAVVDIQSTSGRQAGPDGQRMPTSGGEGSGFILRPDGYIVTNDHVVGGFDNVKVILKDGRSFDGKVIRAHDSDLAVVKINATNLPTLAFGDSNKLKPGQMAMAVGAPFGLEQSVTFGHISALGRDKTLIEDRYYPDMIQTDTAINMGNSGGPLTNMDGQVVGINTAIYSPSGTSAGIGFAIPSNQVRLIVDKLIESGKIVRSQIGIAPENLTDYQKEQKHINGGALVLDAPEAQPAGMAGIKKDDIIVKVGHTAVNNQLDLRNSMLIYAPGSTVPVEFIRDGQHKTVSVKLTKHEEAPPATMQQLGGHNRFQQGPDFQFPNDPQQFFKNFPGMGDDGQGQPRTHRRSAPQNNDGKAHLGATVGPADESARQQFSIPSGVKGAVIEQIVPGSVADNLGMQPGDVVTKIGDKTIGSADELVAAVKGMKAGDSTQIEYARYGNGSTSTFSRTVTF